MDIRDLAAYKRNVAGRYRKVAPCDIQIEIEGPDEIDGPYTVSPKIDGETWFVGTHQGRTCLMSPSGRCITTAPLLSEAARILYQQQDLVLAGELYVPGDGARASLSGLRTALGRGVRSYPERLRFAAFDVLGRGNGWGLERVGFLEALLDCDLPALPDACLPARQGGSCHRVPFERVDGPLGVLDAYQRLVTSAGHEGIVVRFYDGRIAKIKPEYRTRWDTSQA